MKFLKSLFTDIEWDGDLTKVAGLVLVALGVIGFFLEKPGFEWLIGFGGGLVSTGKFSKQG